ncbi:MAG: ABC transporter ATP-binding protein [candidate division Zixibacteria bacterium]|nr:ABC transporter ATP-binding protein [candidate division Zixibacteria bacterium]
MSYLVLDGLSKSYGKVPALRDFSLTVEKGDIFALVGPDGAGKTTALRIVCQLIVADAGRVFLDGHNLAERFDALKSILGYMPQTFSLYQDLSVEENLIFFGGMYGVTGEAYRARRDYLYGFSNLGPFADRRAGALSGGMKQKLALSCALMHDPHLLILDEPTTGVDPLSRRQFWEILLHFRSQGTTIVVSTPYMDEVARADHAAFMFGGRRLSVGTPSDLAAQFDGQVLFLDLEPSSTLIDKLNTIDGLSARRFGSAMHLYIAKDQSPARFAGPLASLGIDTTLIRPASPSLEDRFIQLMETGA